MVRGMGRAFSRVIGVAVTGITVVVISACGAPAPKGPNAFARRASFDLNCPVEQLDFVPIKESSPRTYGVIGCHRRTTYTEACSTAAYGMYGIERRCVWVMDGPLQTEVPAPAPAR